jgi:hypothetical protein
MFVLRRWLAIEGSINQRGHFQTEPMGLDVEVKDASKFPDKWAYYTFDNSQKSSEAISSVRMTLTCHDQNAAVEHSFVQFYPYCSASPGTRKQLKTVKLP